jgi:hypothetical protein
MNAAKAELATALVVMVGNSWLSVTHALVQVHQVADFHMSDCEVHVCRSWPNDFLLILCDIWVADRVLHAPPLVGEEFTLQFHCSCCSIGCYSYCYGTRSCSPLTTHRCMLGCRRPSNQSLAQCAITSRSIRCH